MQSVTSDRNLADRRILETWGRMDSLQEKTREGRGIRQEQVVIPVLSETTAGIYTPRRMICDYMASEDPSGGVGKIVRFGKEEPPAITLPESVSFDASDSYEAERTESFRNSIVEFVRKFQENKRDNLDALQLCLIVTKEIWRRFKYTPATDGDFSFMRVTLGALYTEYLDTALQMLQDQARIGRSWEYVKELNYLAQYFKFFLKADLDRDVCMKVIASTYFQFLTKEVNYLDYIKDSPLIYSVRDVVSIMRLMLENGTPACYFGYLKKQEIINFKAQQTNLLTIISNNMNDKGVDGNRKGLAELRNAMLLKTTDTWAARRYHDELRWRLDEVMLKSDADDISDQQRLCLLETLIEFYEQYRDSVSEFRILRKDLQKKLMNVTALILMSIIPSADNTAHFKTEALLLICYMYKREMLDRKCEQLYLLCIPPQEAVVRATSGTDSEMYAQCSQQVDLIFTCLKIKHGNCLRVVAELLRKLFDEYQRIIAKLDCQDSLRTSISVLEGKVYGYFFSNIFSQYYSCKKDYKNPRLFDKRMSRLRYQIMEAEPYLFLLSGTQKGKWKKIACSAWNTHLRKLSGMESFNKDSIDSLLVLKRTAPDILPHDTVKKVQRALLQILSFMLKHAEDTGYALIEGVMELSRWIDDLDKVHPLSETVTSCNEQWKEKYESIMSTKVAVPSDTSAGTMSASADSGIEGVSPGAAGCRPHAGQSVTQGGTQPLTALPDIPTPAACRSSQQPVLVSGPLPVFSPETSVRLHLIPPPNPLSVPQNVSAGDQSCLPGHPQFQTRFRQLPACALVQPQRQTVWQQQFLFWQPTISSAYRPEYPWVSGLQHRLEWFAEPAGPVHLPPPVNHEPSQMPIQNAGDQRAVMVVDDESARSRLLPCHQSLDLPLPFQYPFGLPKSVFTPDPDLEVCLRRYSPVDYATCEMGNDKVILGQRYLLCITNHYLQQKQNGAWGPTPEIHLPANLGSCYYPAFVQGMAYLVNWLFQINDGFMARDDIRQPLTRLYHEDGAAMIRNLFDRLVQYQGSIGNFNVLSNLVGLRNYLLYVRSLPGLENDNQPGCCPGQ